MCGEGRQCSNYPGPQEPPSPGNFYPKKQWLIPSEYPESILPFSGYKKLWPPNLEWRKLRHSKGKGDDTIGNDRLELVLNQLDCKEGSKSEGPLQNHSQGYRGSESLSRVCPSEPSIACPHLLHPSYPHPPSYRFCQTLCAQRVHAAASVAAGSPHPTCYCWVPGCFPVLHSMN